MNTNRREFIRKTALAGGSAFIASSALANPLLNEPDRESPEENRLIVPKGNGLRITGTFLDEISHDIPHQNWGEKEWDRDFQYMKAIGIDTVILIRSGYRKFITYPSPYLLKQGCYMPSVDLLDMFLRLADKQGMTFYFGLYDSGKYWDTGDMSWEVESNKYVIDEVWKMYGSRHKSFGGWYISGEISRATKGAIGAFHTLGKQCKEVSDGLPTFISPWIMMWWMRVLSRTGILIMMNWMRSFPSIKSWPISMECNVGQMRNLLTGICLSAFSQSSLINSE